MSTDAHLAGMPTEQRNEILWGRQGLPTEFFGPELLTEALFTVFSKIELSTMRGFIPFETAFTKHHFGLDNLVIEVIDECTARRNIHGDDRVNHKLFTLDMVWGIGTFGVSYDVVPRSPNASSETKKVTRPEWEEIVRQNNERRKTFPDAMPEWQISAMQTKRIFLCKNGYMVVFEVDWQATKLSPEGYKPMRFQVTKVTYSTVHDTRDKCSWHDFLTNHGLRAGRAVLFGLEMALKSSNYQLQEALEPNIKAERIVHAIRKRIS